MESAHGASDRPESGVAGRQALSAGRSPPVLVAHFSRTVPVGFGGVAPRRRRRVPTRQARRIAIFAIGATGARLRPIAAYFTGWRARNRRRAAPHGIRLVLANVLSFHIR